MIVDPAIVRLLSLDPSTTSMSAHGGGGMSSASTYKISTISRDGTSKSFFLKSGYGSEAAVMFEGEHASLNAIHYAVPTLCPASLGWGKFDESQKYFLITDFLDLSSRRTSSASSGESLAMKMAKLHVTRAPIPEGYDKPMFGFPSTTCCGDTPQDNSYKSSWAEFFAENRLRFIMKRSEKANGSDKELAQLVNRTIETVVPRLIGDDHLNGGHGISPVVVHGDLWSGNASQGKFGVGMEEPEDLVFDPSACYAHNEYDLGIMQMFGGFGARFFNEYHKICPKVEPMDEYEDRISLYELYHHLNHHALFGGGYRNGAISIMQKLIRKYSKDES